MSLALRSTVTKALIGGVAVAAAAFGAVAAMASTSPTKQAAPPPVDHQLCYNATANGFVIPPGIILKNQFSPNGFMPTVGPLVWHCNPVVKIANGVTYPITNPNAHLACFYLNAPTQPTPMVVVTNQFGSATLQPGQPNMLCLPTWKSLTGPPNKTPNQPPGLNHFTCYPVTVVSGAYRPPALKLQDEFAPAPVPATANPIPNELCLPTDKYVNGVDYPIINPSVHLLCFPVTPTPILQPWDQNQFGTSAVNITQTNSICLPSSKKIVGGG